MNPIETRRRLLGCLGLSLWLAGCGGGGTGSAPGNPPPVNRPPGNPPPGNAPPGSAPPAAPTIARFEANVTTAYVGDSIRVRADFSHGQGRIEPDVGAVVSGTETVVGPLDRSRTLRLVVSQPGQTDAVRDLPVRVDFRDRYLAIDLHKPISQHSAVLTGDGQVLLIGGSRGEGALAHQVDRYDPRTHTITQIGSLRQGRAQASATRLPDGRVLVAGGELSGNTGPTAELVDERTGEVVDAGRLSVSRVGHAAIALPNGRVLVTGGIAPGEGAAFGLSRTAEIWEPGTRNFRRLASSMLEPRANHTLSLLPDGRVLIVGGYTNAAQPLFAELFDPSTEQFVSLFRWYRPRAEHAAFVQPDGKVLIVGGEQPQAGQEDWEPTASVLRFDPANLSFTELPPLMAPRTLVRGAMLPSGELLLFGGRHIQSQNSVSAERYDPATGGVRIEHLDGERAHHTVTRLPSGRIAIFGGESRLGRFASSVRIYE